MPSPGWCAISRDWKVAPEVARKADRLILQFEAETGLELTIISGYRSPSKQRRLREAGRPAADPRLSNHTRCPAEALDFRVSTLPTATVKATFGRIAQDAGFRWGGGSPPDSRGIPSDWNHVDLGPRRIRHPEDFQ